MTIKEVKRTGKGDIEIRYVPAGNGDQFVLKSSDAPAPELLNAFTALRIPACNLANIPAPEKWLAGLELFRVVIDHRTEGERPFVKFVLSKEVSGLEKHCYLTCSPSQYTVKVQLLVDNLSEAASEYVRGNRSQIQIPFEERENGTVGNDGTPTTKNQRREQKRKGVAA